MNHFYVSPPSELNTYHLEMVRIGLHCGRHGLQINRVPGAFNYNTKFPVFLAYILFVCWFLDQGEHSQSFNILEKPQLHLPIIPNVLFITVLVIFWQEQNILYDLHLLVRPAFWTPLTINKISWINESKLHL